MSTASIYVRLSRRARDRANACLGCTLPWTFVLPRVERHSTGGVALVTPEQYDQIKGLPGVTRLAQNPWPRPEPQQGILL